MCPTETFLGQSTHTHTSIAWKLRVFNSIVISKLMYGLETIQLTQTELNKLDSFQMKCIRRILKVPPAYIDRTQTINF